MRAVRGYRYGPGQPKLRASAQALFLNGIVLSQLVKPKAKAAEKPKARRNVLAFDPLTDRFEDGAELAASDLPHVAEAGYESMNWISLS